MIDPETIYAQIYIHLVKGYEKIVWHKYFSNELVIIAQVLGNRASVSNTIFFIQKLQVPQDRKVKYRKI